MLLSSEVAQAGSTSPAQSDDATKWKLRWPRSIERIKFCRLLSHPFQLSFVVIAHFKAYSRTTMNRSKLAFYLCLLFAANFCLVGPLYGQDREATQEVVLHPIMNDTFVCAEHAEGELRKLGDALGKDCMVIRMDSTRAPDKRLPSLFEGSGLKNEDWFGWEVPLLAPCDGTVESTQAPVRTNRPPTCRSRYMSARYRAIS